MEGREILEMFMRSVGEHMSANGKAIVSINGKAALTVTVNRTTGEISAKSITTDTTAADELAKIGVDLIGDLGED